MKWFKVTMLMLAALAVPAAAQAQDEARAAASKPKEIVVVGSGVPDADHPIILGRLYNPSRAVLLEPEDLGMLAAGNVREATLSITDGPFVEALRWLLENRETLGALSLKTAPTGERAGYQTVTLEKVSVADISPSSADRYGRVKVQFHWDRPEGAAAAPLIGKAIGNVAAEGNEDAAVETPDPGQGWYTTRPYISLLVDGVEIAQFSELQGINTEAEPPTMVLKRGKSRSPQLSAWHEAVRMGDISAARKSASIIVYGYKGAVARYELTNAWPSKIEIGSLKAGASEALMETVTIVCEHIQRVTP